MCELMEKLFIVYNHRFRSVNTHVGVFVNKLHRFEPVYLKIYYRIVNVVKHDDRERQRKKRREREKERLIIPNNILNIIYMIISNCVCLDINV